MKRRSGPATCSSHGAVTILNATATGTGCALAVEGGVTATWQWEETPGLRWQNPEVDDRLAYAVLAHLRRTLPGAPRGAAATTRATHPPACGLKTSSSAAAALLGAARQAFKAPLAPRLLVPEAVAVSRQAGVTLTGAFDDQAAVTLGGCHITDNNNDRIVQTLESPSAHVAIWVPDHGIDKRAIAQVDPSPWLDAALENQALAESGRVAEAMTANGALFTQIYQSAGLPVTDAPAKAALTAGALGAGLSGTGPAVAALFAEPVELPAVKGGRWTWTQTVPAASQSAEAAP